MKRKRFAINKNESVKEKAENQIVELSKRIEFYVTEYSVELLAEKMRKQDFVIPEYQRRFTWEPERQSRFIESLVLGFPIPFLFFWERSDGKLEIVDGVQRLETISRFIFDELQLLDLQSLTALSYFRFSDLPESRQRKVKNRSIRGIVLNEHADEHARFDMFERINTGSKIANMAEVRRGALSGDFMSLIIELSRIPEFTKLAPVSEKREKEREHEELVARFFAYSDGLEGYRDRPAEFIFNYVKKMNEAVRRDEGLINEYRCFFKETMQFISGVFPFGFRKSARGNATPRSRFEAISIGSRLALKECPNLRENGDLNVNNWLDSKEFGQIVRSDGANSIGLLRRRIDFVKNNLLKSNEN